MHFHPFAVTIPHVAYACLGGFVVLFGMFSLFLREKLYIGEACWAFLFGVIIGPYGAGIFNPRGWGSSEEVTNAVTLEFTRVVLAIGVFAIGVELPKAYMARHWRSLFFLLVPVMTWGWFVSAGLIYALIPSLNFLSSLAVAACLTPTDPILAAAVVGGKYADKHVPAHIRHLLAAESGCNDGAAFPFLYIALYLIIDLNTGNAISDWFLFLWLYQVILGIIIGSMIGFGFRHLMKFCERHDLIDRHSFVAQYVSLAMLTIGVTTLLGSDDLLAAFACGTTFAWDGFFNKQTEESVFSSVIDLLFNIATFVFVGAWMPFNDFHDADLTLSVWRLIVIAVLVFLLKRLPIMIALYKWIPDVKTFREAMFCGHFGPIGIGAVFISTLATGILRQSHLESNRQVEILSESIQPIVAFMVLCSIIIHGLSIPSFSLGRRVHTVSRTWSRHAAPDWTNQARLVTRGSDIVINRDVDIEQGSLSPDEKLLVENRRKATTGSETTGTPEKQSGHENSPALTVEGSSGAEVNAEPPSNEDEIITEWKEGPNTVIERRIPPGEEVEVEVFKNADAPGSIQDARSSFRGKESEVHHHLASYMDKPKLSPHRLEHDAGTVVKNIENSAKEMERTAKNAILPEATSSSVTDDGDEEGWASDRSNSNQATTSTIQPSPNRRRRSKAPRQVSKLGHVSPSHRSRKHNSMQRGLIGHAAHLIHSQVSRPPLTTATTPDDVTEEDEHRGRFSSAENVNDDAFSAETSTRHSPSLPKSAQHSTPGSSHNSRPGTGYSTPRHFRLDSIKALHSPNSPRDLSPSRSVHFADDENRSGVNTPRVSIFQGESLPGTPSEGVVWDDADAAKNKVTFDLPKPTKQS